ncbi:hypothetical protein ACFSHQ_27745 [Gemmobacter lanyuensis]
MAERFNPDLKRVYDRLIDVGKRQKVAPPAVMRKLVILVNALVAGAQKWPPTRCCQEGYYLLLSSTSRFHWLDTDDDTHRRLFTSLGGLFRQGVLADP